MDNSTRSRIAGHETNLVRLRRKFSSVTKLPGTVTKLVRKLSKSKIGQTSEKYTMPTPEENEKQLKWSYTRKEERESVYASTETLTESLSSDDDESGVGMKMSSGSELDNEVNGVLDKTITQDLPEKRHSDIDVMTDCEVGESISHSVCPNMPNACTKHHFHVNTNENGVTTSDCNCDHTSESSPSLGSAKSDPTGTCLSVSKNEDLKNILGKSMELEISSFKRRITKYEWLGKDVTRKEHVSKSEPLLSPSKPQNKEVSVQTDEASECEGKESVGNGLEHGGEYIRLLREYDSAGSSSSSRSQSPDLQLVQAVCESSWKNKIISPPRRTQIHFKVLVVGDKKVGKTSILDRHISNSFSDLYQPSSGVNFANEVISWNEESDLHVVYCDIAGEGSLGEMANIYTFAHAMIVVHDATSRLKKLGRNMAKWSEWSKNREVHSILLINKCDEADVDNLKVDDLCSIFGFSAWYKTSAKKNINIESAFYSVLTKMVATDGRLDKQEENPQLVYKHKCC